MGFWEDVNGKPIEDMLPIFFRELSRDNYSVYRAIIFDNNYRAITENYREINLHYRAIKSLYRATNDKISAR